MKKAQAQANKNIIKSSVNLRMELDKQMGLTAIATLMEAPDNEMDILEYPFYGYSKTSDVAVEVNRLALSEDKEKIDYFGTYFESGKETEGTLELADDMTFDWCDVLRSINDWCSGNYSNE